MKTYIEPTTNQVWQFDDDVADVFALPNTPATLIPHVVVPKVKTPAELEAEESAKAKQELAALDLASIPLLRAYIAAKADTPQELKDLEAAAALKRTKIK